MILGAHRVLGALHIFAWLRPKRELAFGPLQNLLWRRGLNRCSW